MCAVAFAIMLAAALPCAAAQPAEGDHVRVLVSGIVAADGTAVDEILQGTNSEERQTAGRRLIRHLLGRRALGAVTTHDLAFHQDERMEPHAVLVHFRESLDDAGDGLSFDYTLRPGLATTRNALRLAERVGLTEPEDEG
jgi:dsDNA-specific endonuclease/ATPase MutS2